MLRAFNKCAHAPIFRKGSQHLVLKLREVPQRSSAGLLQAREPVGCFPARRRLMAALWSRSRSVPHSQECQRSSSSFLTMAPHPLHRWLVMRGSTNTTCRPALAALATQQAWNWPQPASKID